MSIDRWIWTKKRWNIYIQNRTLLSHKTKKWNDVIYSNMDGPRDYYTKWSKSVQSLICVRFFATPWSAACQATLSTTNSWSLLKLMSIESLMPSNHFILCHPLLLLSSNFPASGSFLRSQFFTWSEHSIGASALVLPMHIQGWFPLGLTGLISLLSKGLKSLLQ